MFAIVYIVIAYLFGSLCFAYWLSRARSLPDPLSYGSGNRGATNVYRGGSRQVAAVVLIMDSMKAVVPLLCARYWHLPDAVLVLMGCACVLGHMFPIFASFKGGKGVATGLGTIAVWYWPAVVAAVVCWIAVFGVTRLVSVASLGALCICAPIMMYLWSGLSVFFMGSVFLAFIILVAHRQNVRRVLMKQEETI